MNNFLSLFFNNDDRQLMQELLFHKFIFWEKLLFLGMISLLIFPILEENFYFEDNFKFLNNEIQIDIGYESTLTKFFRYLLIILMSVSQIFLCFRKYSYFLFLKSTAMIQLTSKYYCSKMFFEWIFEAMLLACQTYPNINKTNSSKGRGKLITYLDDTILTFICIIIRMLFLLRGLLYLSRFSSAKAVKTCYEIGANPGIKYSLRAEFHYDMKRFLCLLLFFVVVVLGFLLRLSERSSSIYSKLDWDYVWNCFWNIIVTLTTVGYGDLTPTTDLGRIIIGFTAILGSVITSLVVIVFLTIFSYSPNQDNAYEQISAIECQKKLKNSAAYCILLSLKYNLKVTKAKNYEINEIFEIFLVDLKKKIEDFVHWRKLIVSFKNSRRIDRKLVAFQSELIEDVDQIGVFVNIYEKIHVKTPILLENFELMNEKIKQIEQFHVNFIYRIKEINESIHKNKNENQPPSPFFGDIKTLDGFNEINENYDIKTITLEKIEDITLKKLSDSQILINPKRYMSSFSIKKINNVNSDVFVDRSRSIRKKTFLGRLNSSFSKASSIKKGNSFGQSEKSEKDTNTPKNKKKLKISVKSKRKFSLLDGLQFAFTGKQNLEKDRKKQFGTYEDLYSNTGPLNFIEQTTKKNNLMQSKDDFEEG